MPGWVATGLWALMEQMGLRVWGARIKMEVWSMTSGWAQAVPMEISAPMVVAVAAAVPVVAWNHGGVLQTKVILVEAVAVVAVADALAPSETGGQPVAEASVFSLSGLVRLLLFQRLETISWCPVQA